MEAFLEQDLLTVLPTILVPTVVVLAPIAYLILSNRQKLSGEYRRNLRVFAPRPEGSSNSGAVSRPCPVRT
ncbi:hypothetical protein J3R83DRAFT_6128 [Lanmaoa asiatica]|nr:hypothetical protein J3R83DRAFT_6128 [Lanmaoa asiatica]